MTWELFWALMLFPIGFPFITGIVMIVVLVWDDNRDYRK
jgi:hypothetical protein